MPNNGSLFTVLRSYRDVAESLDLRGSPTETRTNKQNASILSVHFSSREQEETIHLLWTFFHTALRESNHCLCLNSAVHTESPRNSCVRDEVQTHSWAKMLVGVN